MQTLEKQKQKKRITPIIYAGRLMHVCNQGPLPRFDMKTVYNIKKKRIKIKEEGDENEHCFPLEISLMEYSSIFLKRSLFMKIVLIVFAIVGDFDTVNSQESFRLKHISLLSESRTARKSNDLLLK